MSSVSPELATTPRVETRADEARDFSIVCISSQQWHVDLPTNRQQIMRRAAERGHRILFVENGEFLGRWLHAYLRGGDRHALAGLFRPVEVAPGVEMRKAFNLLPWGHTRKLPNAINAALTAALLRRSTRRLRRPTVLWVYDPCAAPLVGACAEDLSVYDCVDDYAEQTGGSAPMRRLVEASDLETARNVGLVFATATPLFERHRRLNVGTHLVPNVGDYSHFVPAADPDHAAPDLDGLAHPVLGFAGNLMASKVDFDLLESVARARPDWTLLLIGPVRPDAQESLDRLVGLRNVLWVGAKAYAELPRYVAAFDVGLIPYVSSAYTQSCFPLKLYEYLAAGKPVVASGLPELGGREPDVVVADGVQAFVDAVESALARLSPEDRARRMALASQNTWETRTERLLELVSSALEP